MEKMEEDKIVLGYGLEGLQSPFLAESSKWWGQSSRLKLLHILGSTPQISILDFSEAYCYEKDFVTFASKAHIAILVLDIDNRATDWGRQLRLCRAIGIEKIVVLIHNLDKVNWDRSRYTQSIAYFTDFYKKKNNQKKNQQPLFSDKDVVFIPCGSDFTTIASCVWYENDSLLEYLKKEYLKKEATDRAGGPYLHKFEDLTSLRKLMSSDDYKHKDMVYKALCSVDFALDKCIDEVEDVELAELWGFRYDVLKFMVDLTRKEPSNLLKEALEEASEFQWAATKDWNFEEEDDPISPVLDAKCEEVSPLLEQPKDDSPDPKAEQSRGDSPDQGDPDASISAVPAVKPEVSSGEPSKDDSPDQGDPDASISSVPAVKPEVSSGEPSKDDSSDPKLDEDDHHSGFSSMISPGSTSGEVHKTWKQIKLCSSQLLTLSSEKGGVYHGSLESLHVKLPASFIRVEQHQLINLNLLLSFNHICLVRFLLHTPVGGDEGLLFVTERVYGIVDFFESLKSGDRKTYFWQVFRDVRLAMIYLFDQNVSWGGFQLYVTEKGRGRVMPLMDANYQTKSILRDLQNILNKIQNEFLAPEDRQPSLSKLLTNFLKYSEAQLKLAPGGWFVNHPYFWTSLERRQFYEELKWLTGESYIQDFVLDRFLVLTQNWYKSIPAKTVLESIHRYHTYKSNADVIRFMGSLYHANDSSYDSIRGKELSYGDIERMLGTKFQDVCVDIWRALFGYHLVAPTQAMLDRCLTISRR